jgi:uncharacterized damage-inducible protein DinB
MYSYSVLPDRKGQGPGGPVRTPHPEELGVTHIDLSTRTTVPTAFDERATATQLLSYVRLTVHAKCVGLSQSDAVRTPLPSSPAMSIAGLVSHLRWSEAFWIDVVFLGGINQWPGTDDDSELQMRRGLERPLAELLDEYATQAAHTDEVVASRDWDAEAVGRDETTGKPFALRYIVGHLIHETARHNGHLDILRELADGVTGD